MYHIPVLVSCHLLFAGLHELHTRLSESLDGHVGEAANQE